MKKLLCLCLAATFAFSIPARAQEKSVVDQLNHLLSDLSVLYQNVRGLHWTVKGEAFFELHEEYEKLYNSLSAQIDDIAERINAIGGTPLLSYQAYHKQSDIMPLSAPLKAREGIENVANALKKIIQEEKNIIAMTGQLKHAATESMLADLVLKHEKFLWMYESNLVK